MNEKDENRKMEDSDIAIVRNHILILNIIGEIEGHEHSPGGVKSTKYEQIFPLLAEVEICDDIHGILILINTVGGDVEAGLAIAEMIATVSKPKVCLILGGGHSIGVPLAVSGDITLIADSATMVIHPIRINGTVLGVRQNYKYIEKMQDRIIDFTVKHSSVKEDELRNIMFNTKELTRDIGSILVGQEAVNCGIAYKVGGIKEALDCLYVLINESKKCKI